MARMTSFIRTAKDHMADAMPPIASVPDVPSNLCIALTENELEKLGVDDDVEVGDLLHLRIMIQATSVHKTADSVRIEAAVIAGVIEDEDQEEGLGDDEDEE